MINKPLTPIICIYLFLSFNFSFHWLTFEQVLPPLCAELRNVVMQPMILPMVLTIAEAQVSPIKIVLLVAYEIPYKFWLKLLG